MSICVHTIQWFKIEENVMRMKQSKMSSALWTGIHAPWWPIYRCCSMSGLEWYFHNESQLVKVGFIQFQEPHSGLHCRSLWWLNIDCRPQNTWQQQMQLRDQYPTRLSLSNSLWYRVGVCPNFHGMLANAMALPWIREPGFYSLTLVINVV